MQTASNVVDFSLEAPRARTRPASSVDAARDRQFAMMLRAFRETGGLARGDEVADALVQRGVGDLSQLARWIVSREVLSLDWKGEVWVPWFQFDLRTMALREAAPRVTAELVPAFDRWQQALWFATPNVWLDERLPADVLATDPAGVMSAARADRFADAG